MSRSKTIKKTRKRRDKPPEEATCLHGGFEFAYNLDGSNKGPLIRDLPVDGAGAYAIGELVLLNSDGQCAKVTANAGEVTGVIMEARASGSDGDELKVAIITRNQVWRCSMDDTTTAAVKGYTKTIDVAGRQHHRCR